MVKGKFHGKQKEATLATLETVKGTKITCTTSEGPGEFKSAKEVQNIVATFKGCTSGGIACESAGQGEGVIQTFPLEGQLGIEKTGTTPPLTDKLAVELHGPAFGALAEFSCAGIPVVVRGAVLHPVTTGKMVKVTTEKFAAAKGVQKPSHFVGEPPNSKILETSTGGGTFEQSGQTITAIVEYEEPIEANPVA